MIYFKAFAFTIVMLFMSGCVVGDVAYHYDSSNEVRECHGSCYEQDGYHLGIVEFDDEGLYHNRQQPKKVFEWLRGLLKAPGQGAIVITYSHGWQHNAKETPGKNLSVFRESLAKQAVIERELTNELRKRPGLEELEPRKIIGLYTGWRGDSLPIKYAEYATFWNRKRTAQLVGLRDGKDFFSSVESIVESAEQDSDNPDNNKEITLVAIGHSFGALLVHTAVTGPVIADLNRGIEANKVAIEKASESKASADTQSLKGYGDMVVLINPAFEALDFSNLVLKLREEKFDTSQRPFYMVFSSESDNANKLAFVLGRGLSTLFRNYKDDTSQSWGSRVQRHKADIQSLGHYKKFRTHELDYGNPDSDIGSYARASTPGSPEFAQLCFTWKQWRTTPEKIYIQAIDDDIPKWFVLKQVDRSEKDPDTEAVSLDPRVPVTITNVDTEIFKGHGISDSETLLNIVSKLLIFTTASQSNLFQCTVPRIDVPRFGDYREPKIEGLREGLESNH